jgi:hypothetical protein
VCSSIFEQTASEFTALPTVWPSAILPTVTRAKPQTEIKETTPGETGGFLISRIRYNDIWGSEHNTYLCVRLMVTKVEGRYIFIPCPGGNGRDDD